MKPGDFYRIIDGKLEATRWGSYNFGLWKIRAFSGPDAYKTFWLFTVFGKTFPLCFVQ